MAVKKKAAKKKKKVTKKVTKKKKKTKKKEPVITKYDDIPVTPLKKGQKPSLEGNFRFEKKVLWQAYQELGLRDPETLVKITNDYNLDNYYWNCDPNENKKGMKFITLSVHKLPKWFLDGVIFQSEAIPTSQKVEVKSFLEHLKDWEDIAVDNVQHLSVVLSVASHFSDGPNMELMLNGRWYPIRVNFRPFKSYNWGHVLEASYTLYFGNIKDVHWRFITEAWFEDETGTKKKKKIIDFLLELDFRPVGQTNMAEYNRKIKRAEEMSNRVGHQVLIKSPAATYFQWAWFNKVEIINFGSEEFPKNVIIEPELESEIGDTRSSFFSRERDGQAEAVLPFVRTFSLDLKRYVYADVEDIEEYAYDERAIERIVLPEEMDDILQRIFTADTSLLFGDILTHKHGGMVVLASGGTGVGKTLTAEVFAEYTKRPLYVLEVGELGTKPDQVEERLQKVFQRAIRWNAVLLFDEADIFMAQRDKNLERNAIVGIFLRLLDYYPGLLFLTTNRPNILDQAFASRVTLHLEYPPLNKERRAKIWDNFLEVAGINLFDSGLNEVLVTSRGTAIPEVELNGRQIRNIMRLIKLLHPKEVTPEEIANIAKKYTCNIGNASFKEQLLLDADD